MSRYTTPQGTLPPGTLTLYRGTYEPYIRPDTTAAIEDEELYNYIFEHVSKLPNGDNTAVETVSWRLPRYINRFCITQELIELPLGTNYPLRYLSYEPDCGIVLETDLMVAEDAAWCPYLGEVTVIDSNGHAVGERIPTPGRISIPESWEGSYRLRFKGIL
jgi:hypothetical protein